MAEANLHIMTICAKLYQKSLPLSKILDDESWKCGASQHEASELFDICGSKAVRKDETLNFLIQVRTFVF